LLYAFAKLSSEQASQPAETSLTHKRHIWKCWLPRYSKQQAAAARRQAKTVHDINKWIAASFMIHVDFSAAA